MLKFLSAKVGNHAEKQMNKSQTLNHSIMPFQQVQKTEKNEQNKITMKLDSWRLYFTFIHFEQTFKH